MQVLNFDILRHPSNWLIVLLMLVIAGYAGHLLLSYAGVEPGGQPNSRLTPRTGGGFSRGVPESGSIAGS